MVRAATRVYSAATRLLPPDFRARYGDQLVECFAAIAADARRDRGRVALSGVLVRSLADLLDRAAREHWARARAGAFPTGADLSGWGHDVVHAARRLRRRPAFSLASLATLALGVAAATSVFTLVHRVVLSPLPYPASDRLVELDHGATELGFGRALGMTYGFFRFYRENLSTVESSATFSWISLTLTGEGDPLRLEVMRVTPSLAEVLGVAPQRGRWFTDAEGGPGEPAAVMLSNALWRDRFGSDPAVIGRSVQLDDVPHEVVGVMPPSLTAPFAGAEVFVPREIPSTGIGGWNERAVARMASGVTPADVEREMQAVLPRLRAANDDPERVRGYLDEAGVFPSVASLKASVVGDVRATLWILLGTVGVVLLIAVANVANLFLVRSQESQRESAVRAALGAGRLRLAREFLAETGLLAGSACALGLGAAWVAVAVLRERAPVNIPRLDEVRLDAVSVGVSAVVCLLTALLLGIVPALGRRTRDMAATLKDASGRATAGPHRVRGLSLLVTTQVALALVLLVGSGLLFRTFQALRAVDLGFSERDALTFQVGLPPAAYDRVAAIRFHDALLERLAALPGVESAAIVGQCLPLSGDMCWGETLEVEGRPAPAGEMPKVTGVRVVSPGYFGTLGIPVRGRGIEAEDVRSGAPGAVLSESAAHAYFPGEDPIGRRLSFGDDPVWFTVVGVAGDVRSRVATDEFTSLIYLPVRADVTDGPPPHNVAYAVTTTLPPASIASAVRAAVAEADPDVPLGDVRALADLIDSATAPTAFTLALVGLAALLSLVLGTVGVYAVVAYSVSRRTPEIGVRMALGARASDVRRMVVRQGGAAVVVGAAAGLAGAFALTRLIESMLFGVSATDPLTYAAVTALMLAVAAAAMWLPARRAARVDPVRALRSE